MSGELSSYDFDSALATHYDLPCRIEWSTPNVLIVPFDIFDHGSIDHYLISAGMMRRGIDRSMFAVRGEYVAVWAVDESLAEYLESRIECAEQTHSLLCLLSRYNYLRDTIVISIDNANLMHIAVWGGESLETALSTQITSSVDVLFYCQHLAKNDPAMEYRIICDQSVDRDVVQLLGKYYKGVTAN